MYNLADHSYEEQPRKPSDQTIHGLARWLAEYTSLRSLKHFRIILHGGEPLLAGKHTIRKVVEACNAACGSDVRVTYSLVTNGILLDEEWLELFSALDISFSLSLDGPAEYHDRFRLYRDGRPTHATVEAWIRKLLSSPQLNNTYSRATLCVLHPDMDGARLVDYFHSLGLAKVDFLLPDQNHIHGSPFYPSPATASSRYGLLLRQAYRKWREIDDPDFTIRKFELLALSFMGVPLSLDSLGTGPITVFTVETSGEVEPVDTMKICGHRATKTGINIATMDALAVETIPQIALGLAKGSVVTAKCRSCRFLQQCGGGYLPHRWTGSAFEETVYCDDMIALCTDIHEDLAVAGLARML